MTDAQPSLRQTPVPDRARAANGKSYIRRLIPGMDRWMSRRELRAGLLAESMELEGRAEAWERRGHWEMAAKCTEMAAEPVRKLLDIELRREFMDRYAQLLKDATVRYSLELGEAARYDPAIFFRMSKLAARMGDVARTRTNYERMLKGFELMVSDPMLDSLVTLNRMKRRFLAALWEGGQDEACRLAANALEAAAMVRAPGTDRRPDTARWLERQFEERYGDAYPLRCALYGGSVVSRP
ncbi:MAG: hypothetical protein AB1529_00675 [Candidatus Micrarchaeota archaeon]